MDEKNISGFKASFDKALEHFRSFDKSKPIRLVSHLDADGISAAAIMIKILNSENYRYSISIVQQLGKDVIDELSLENYSSFIFTDLGSGQLKSIREKLSDRKVLILDHHEPERIELPENIVQINPHLYGINGNDEISGAGVVYFFSKKFNSEDLAHIAVIGSVGDIQDHGSSGFSSLNTEILENAVAHNKIKVITGLRLFGVQTKPLHKVLEYSTDPYIPGVTGSESGAIQFLQQIGINPKCDSGWRKLVHLSEEDMRKLATGIIMRRMSESKPEDIVGPVYIMRDEDKESPTRDVKEFATLLNACGRLGKASFGIGACLGDPKIKQKAISSLSDYKRELVNAINWYNNNKDSPAVTKGSGYIIINTEDHILPTIVGTLASILAKSRDIPDNTYIMSMAKLRNNTTKVSLRIAGLKPRLDINVHAVMSDIVKIAGGEAGGHKNAAGAMIETAKEAEFLKAAKQVLDTISMEEAVIPG